jgi:hypothetical protein
VLFLTTAWTATEVKYAEVRNQIQANEEVITRADIFNWFSWAFQCSEQFVSE